MEGRGRQALLLRHAGILTLRVRRDNGSFDEEADMIKEAPKECRMCTTPHLYRFYVKLPSDFVIWFCSQACKDDYSGDSQKAFMEQRGYK